MALQGNLGARRAAYEARWRTFGAAVAGGKFGLIYAEVPWPADDPEDVRAIILYGADTPIEVGSSSARVGEIQAKQDAIQEVAYCTYSARNVMMRCHCNLNQRHTPKWCRR